jgi:CHAT domain-containing protein/tetratricopeptide (TPR) repeat protein
VLQKATPPRYGELYMAMLRLAAVYEKTDRKDKSKEQRARASRLFNRLLDLSQQAARQGAYAKAEPLQRAILRIDRETRPPDHPNIGISLYELANILLLQGKNTEAESLIGEAITILENAKPPRQRLLGLALRVQYQLHFRRGEFQEAEASLKKAKAAFANVPNARPAEVAKLDAELAAVYGRIGPVSEAESLLLKSIPILKQHLPPEDVGLLQATENLRRVSEYLGKLERVRELQSDIEKALDRLPARHPFRLLVLNSLARAYVDTGDLAKAEGLFRQALGGLPSNDPEVPALQQGLASIYLESGDYAKAEETLKDSLEALQRLRGQEWKIAAVKHNLAVLELQVGRPDVAKQLFQEVLQLSESHLAPDHSDIALALDGLASAHQDLNEYREAEKCSLKAARILAKYDSPYLIGIKSNLSSLYLREGRYDKAMTTIKEALDSAEKRLPPNSFVALRTRSNYVLCLVALGQIKEAESSARELSTAYRHLLSSSSVFQSERQQLAMNSLARTHLDHYLSVARIRGASPDEVYQAVLDWKGNVTARQILARQLRGLAATGSDSTRATVRELQDLALRLEFLGNARPEADLDRASKRRAEFRSLLNRKEALEVTLGRELRKGAGGWEDARPAVASLQAALKHVGGNVALVDFLEYDHVMPGGEKRTARVERRLSAFVIRPGRPVQWIDLDLGETITGMVDAWRDAVAKGLLPVQSGQRLRQTVWDKLGAHLKGADVVLYSPDGALCRLPLAALPNKKGDSYLLREVATVAVPTPALLPTLLSRGPLPDATGSGASLLLVGNIDYDQVPAAASGNVPAALDRSPPRGLGKATFGQVKGAKPAMESVRKIFRQAYPAGASEELEGQKASKAGYLSASGKYRWQLIVTHGFFAQGMKPGASRAPHAAPGRAVPVELGSTEWHPGLLSGLAFAGANRKPPSAREDGILTAVAVSELPLSQTELVVLAACETGLGQATRGEGVLGLQRAYQMAGARSVLASHWKVSEKATMAFLEQFHRNFWEKKRTKLDALCLAQRWMLQNYTPTAEELRLGPVREAGKPLRPELARPRRNGDPLAPFFWAAFTLSGDWR